VVQVSIVGPGEGETLLLGPAVQMRILEDGSTTEHRLGIAAGREHRWGRRAGRARRAGVLSADRDRPGPAGSAGAESCGF